MNTQRKTTSKGKRDASKPRNTSTNITIKTKQDVAAIEIALWSIAGILAHQVNWQIASFAYFALAAFRGIVTVIKGE